MRRAAMRLFWLAAFALCLTAAACSALDMRGMWEDRAACSIAPSTGDELAPLEALYPEIEWTAYAQGEAALSVANDALPARAAQVCELAFLGDPGRIAPFCVASGRLPREGESGVCALDAQSAWALFRTTDAGGNRVRVDGDALLVVGVLDMERPLLMRCAAPDARLNRLAAGSREELEALASALGEELDAFELSGAEAARGALLLCALPVACLAGFALCALRRRMGWRKEVSNLLLWALAVGFVLAVLWYVPVRLLPTRWSDIEFYTQLLSDFRARELRLPDARDLLMRGDLVRVGAWSLACCAARWMERKCLKSEKGS